MQRGPRCPATCRTPPAVASAPVPSHARAAVSRSGASVAADSRRSGAHRLRRSRPSPSRSRYRRPRRGCCRRPAGARSRRWSDPAERCWRRPRCRRPTRSRRPAHRPEHWKARSGPRPPRSGWYPDSWSRSARARWRRSRHCGSRHPSPHLHLRHRTRSGPVRGRRTAACDNGSWRDSAGSVDRNPPHGAHAICGGAARGRQQLRVPSAAACG